jgi:small GTP-binding protein
MLDGDAKVIMVGASSVGKTCLLIRLRDNDFLEGQAATVAGSSAKIEFNLGTRTAPDIVTFCLWDTAGQEKYRSLTPVYSRDAHCVLLLYDITDRDSFNAVEGWFDLVKVNTHKGCEYLLVGTKGDLEETPVVSEQDAEALKKRVGAMEQFVISAKANRGIDVLARSIRDALSRFAPLDNRAQTVSLTQKVPVKKKGKC